MAQVFGVQQVTGTASVSNGTPSATVIAAQGPGKTLRITKGTLAVTTAAVGGGGVVNLLDGSTVLMTWDANAVKDYYFDFGDVGYKLSSNSALGVSVTTAVTTQASATCAAIALVAS